MLMSLLVLASAAPLQMLQSPDVKVKFSVEQQVGPARARVKLVTPVFLSHSPVAEMANREVQELVRYAFSDFLEASRAYTQLPDVPNVELFHEAVPVVSIAKEDVISLYVKTFEFAGGAHPNRFYHAATWGLKKGKARRLVFADLIETAEDATQVANRVVVPRLIAMGAQWFVDGDRDGLTPEEVDNFVITPAGITWLFSPYQAGPYVQGEFFVKVPWSEIPTSLAPVHVEACK